MADNLYERPMIFPDREQKRELQLYGDVTGEYSPEDLAAIEDMFRRMTELEELGVLDARIKHESEHTPARLAIDLVMIGTHEDLQRKAKKWGSLLKQSDNVGPLYMISH